MRAVDKIVEQIAGDIGAPIYYLSFQPDNARASPPSLYGVYTTMQTPAMCADDKMDGKKAYIYLTMYGDGNVRDMEDTIRQSAIAHGAWVYDSRDAYIERAGKAALSLTITCEVG